MGSQYIGRRKTLDRPLTVIISLRVGPFNDTVVLSRRSEQRHEVIKTEINVADPGCLSRIQKQQQKREG
jgi:hypothetical protein